MKIFAFAGSNSSASINKALVKFVLESFPDDRINLIDLNDYLMPIFSIDIEKNGYPEEARRFLENIEYSDVIICSLAENNRSYSTAFKNIFDWTSRIKVKIFQDRQMFLMTTSPGGFGGGNVMNEAKKFFPEFGADIKETFSLPKFYDNFDFENGKITNPELLQELDQKIINFKNKIK